MKKIGNSVSNILCCSLAGTAMLSMVGCKEKTEPQKPMNVLFIMCDDHSYQTISAYDSRYISTPNIDRIAADGVRFTNSFVANSISGPSRACMLTGKHSHANGFTNNKSSFDGAQQTFPKLLQAQGYETAVIGKWHLTSDPTGFDHWDILIGQGDYYNPTFIRNGEKVQREGYATNVTTDLALEWLENGRDSQKPFCLLLHHKAPHRTWMPDTCDLELFADTEFPLPETFYDNYEGRDAAAGQRMSISKDMDLVYDLKLADKENEIHSNPGLEAAGRAIYNKMDSAQKAAWDTHYDRVISEFKAANLTGKALDEWKYRQYMRDYLRVITSVDRNIGRVLDYLESKGLMDNTLIVYTSDQGFYMGEHGWFDKRFMYEESFRTPLLMRLPGGVKGDIPAMVQNIDYAPTFLELAGASVPQDIHGCSLLPLLQGKEWQPNREALYYHYYEFPDEHAVRPHYGVRTEKYKLIHFYGDMDKWELFDLSEDPNELHNIYGKQGTEQLTDSLKTILLGLQKQYGEEEYIESAAVDEK
ncbi:MAG: sulfatase [Bacteroidaceae bacterium]|nr:sulfatase [Bacteroidaceae bacterium]